MKVIANIIWLIFGGLVMSILWFIVGAIFCVTIIGFPLGMQFFKIAKLYLAPFGKKIKINFESHPFLNVIWAVLLGWEMAIAILVSGLVLLISIIGIPFAMQTPKIAKLTLLPFGAEIGKE